MIGEIIFILVVIAGAIAFVMGIKGRSDDHHSSGRRYSRSRHSSRSSRREFYFDNYRD